MELVNRSGAFKEHSFQIENTFEGVNKKKEEDEAALKAHCESVQFRVTPQGRPLLSEHVNSLNVPPLL